MRVMLPPLLLATALVAQDAPHLDLKVLYAGVPDDARTEQWREFLTPRTARFTVVDVTTLTEAAIGDADLLILDCPDPIVRDADDKPTRINVPKPQQLTTTLACPTIVIGGMAMITDRLQLKSNWL